MLDYETVAGGDKFGNAYVLRLPEGVSDAVDGDPTGVTLIHDKAKYNGAAHKVEVHAHINVSHTASVPCGFELMQIASSGWRHHYVNTQNTTCARWS